jgi:hypothetical protein
LEFVRKLWVFDLEARGYELDEFVKSALGEEGVEDCYMTLQTLSFCRQVIEKGHYIVNDSGW